MRLISDELTLLFQLVNFFQHNLPTLRSGVIRFPPALNVNALPDHTKVYCPKILIQYTAITCIHNTAF